MIRIKRITDCNHIETNKVVKNQLKNKYDNDENYREYKKVSSLNRDSRYRSLIEERDTTKLFNFLFATICTVARFHWL